MGRFNKAVDPWGSSVGLVERLNKAVDLLGVIRWFNKAVDPLGVILCGGET